jgi:hypothetical protein
LGSFLLVGSLLMYVFGIAGFFAAIILFEIAKPTWKDMW